MTLKPDYERDGVRLYLGDCRDVLPHLEGVDAVVTDPPYGIGISANPVRQKHERMTWDNAIPEAEVFERLCAMSKTQIIWGGNYFNLPPTQCFLIWDKVQPENFSLAMCEQAWTNLKHPAKLFKRHVVSYKKHHPTQKPDELMVWCVGFIEKETTVLDPFMGSGTTGVACIRTGRKFIGIEKEPKYFDIAVSRVKEEFERLRMFQPAAAEVQAELFGGEA